MPLSRRDHARTSHRGVTRRQRRRGFVTDQRGNVAMIFALASLPLLAFTGAAIDYGLATRLQVKLQAATDATALGLCQTPQATTTPQLQAQAQTVMSGYMAIGDNLLVDTIAITSTPRKITLTTHVNSRTFFPAFTGVVHRRSAPRSQCATPLPKTFEIALVLDNTGSMTESSGSQTKLQAVQTAASNFVDYVKNNTAFATTSRISIVPFAAAVAIDPTVSGTATASWVDTKGLSDYHWTNVDQASARALGFTSRLSIFNALKAVNSTWAWAGCFDAQPYPESVQDGAPSPAPTQAGYDSLYVPFFAPDEPGNGSNTYAAWNPSNNSSGSATNYSFNSYIDDSNGQSGCSSTSTSFATIEAQSCKYNSPRGVQATTYNTYTGLPNGPNFQCVSRPLQRLTTDATVLKSLINSMTAAGSTNIHEGMIWGWRTLSPLSVFADGAAYSPANSTSPTATNKVMILMTDGTNTWTDNRLPQLQSNSLFRSRIPHKRRQQQPDLFDADRLSDGSEHLHNRTAAQRARPADFGILHQCQGGGHLHLHHRFQRALGSDRQPGPHAAAELRLVKQTGFRGQRCHGTDRRLWPDRRQYRGAPHQPVIRRSVSPSACWAPPSRSPDPAGRCRSD